MKRLILALMLTVFSAQSFAAASALGVVRGNLTVSLGGLITTSTTFGAGNVLFGLIVLADNGEAFINIGSEEAKEAVTLAVQKSVDGEKLSAEESALIQIYAQHMNLSEKAFIETIAEEL